jgi:hypothetical protein
MISSATQHTSGSEVGVTAIVRGELMLLPGSTTSLMSSAGRHVTSKSIHPLPTYRSTAKCIARQGIRSECQFPSRSDSWPTVEHVPRRETGVSH